MDNKHTTDQWLVIYFVLIIAAFFFLPLGILLDLIFIPPLIVSYLAYRRGWYCFFVSLSIHFCVSVLIVHFTYLDVMTYDQFKYFVLLFLENLLDPVLPSLILRGLLKIQSKYFNLAPFFALLLPAYLTYRLNLREKISFTQLNQRYGFSEKTFKKHKEKNDDVLIGINKDNKKPFYLTDQERLRHTQVIGSTGFGKTESVLIPMFENDIRKGNGLMLLDAKADEDLVKAVYKIAKDCGRQSDVMVFNPSIPEISYSYNPFCNFNTYTGKHITPTANMNKLIGAMEWTEPYYKKMSEISALTITNAFPNNRGTADIHKILAALKDPHYLLEKTSLKPDIKSKIQEYCREHKKYKEATTGLIADLGHLCSSDFGPLMSFSGYAISLMEAYFHRQIVIFQVSTLSYSQTAKLFGKMLLRDLTYLCSEINRTVPTEDRKFFPVYIDEFASFAFAEFAEFMRMSRSSGIGVTVLHQSMGDLEIVDPAFKKQIMSNANIKVILKVNDNDTIEEAAKMTGTKEKLIQTHQITNGLFNSTERTGIGSEAMGNEFNIHPRIFRKLKIGDAVVIVNSSNRLGHLQLNHFKIPNYSDRKLQDLFHNRGKKPRIDTLQEPVKTELKLSKQIFGE